MSEERFETLRFLEAVLFAASEPLSEKVLAQRLPEDADLKGLLQELKAHYANRGVMLMQFEDRWSFRTAPDLSHRMSIERKVVRKMTRAAVETLAIIAYHQPVTRAEIEEIRGVAISKGTLDSLLEANWIKPKGRRETPGRPVVWGTTGEFLEHFGLESCEALPGIEEVRAAGLLDARSAVSTLGTQAFAAGQISPDDSEDEEVAAAIELRGEPELDEDEREEAGTAPDLADDLDAGAAAAHLEDDPETVTFAHAKEVELVDAVPEDIDEPARDENGDQEDAEESGDEDDDDEDDDDDDEGDRGVKNP